MTIKNLRKHNQDRCCLKKVYLKQKDSETMQQMKKKGGVVLPEYFEMRYLPRCHIVP